VVVAGAVAAVVAVLVPVVLGAVAGARVVSDSPPEQAEAARRQTATTTLRMRSG
jgi:hypothetical protein